MDVHRGREASKKHTSTTRPVDTPETEDEEDDEDDEEDELSFSDKARADSISSIPFPYISNWPT